MHDVNVINFVDDNASYVSAHNLKDVIKLLEPALVSQFKWFDVSFLRANADGFHFFFFFCIFLVVIKN